MSSPKRTCNITKTFTTWISIFQVSWYRIWYRWLAKPGGSNKTTNNIESLINNNIKKIFPTETIKNSEQLSCYSNDMELLTTTNNTIEVFQFNQRILYKRTKVNIVKIITSHDFEDNIYVIENNKGKRKSNTADLIVRDKNDTSISISSSITDDISFAINFTTPPSRHSTSISDSSTSTFKTSDSSIRVQQKKKKSWKWKNN